MASYALRITPVVMVTPMVYLWLRDWRLGLAIELACVFAVIVFLIVISRGSADRRAGTLFILLNSEFFMWRGVMNLRFVKLDPDEMRNSARLLELRKLVKIQMAYTTAILFFFTALIALDGINDRFSEFSKGLPLVMLSALPLILAWLIVSAFICSWLSDEGRRWKRHEQLGYEFGAVADIPDKQA